MTDDYDERLAGMTGYRVLRVVLGEVELEFEKLALAEHPLRLS